MTVSTQSGLGYDVALGLMGGPADFARIRAHMHDGPMAALWRRFMAKVEKTNTDLFPVADLALAAAVTGRIDLANKAIAGALELVHQPHWVHWDAGCMPLTGMHNAHAVCMAIDWLWPVLNRDTKEALLGGVIAKAQENLSRPPQGVRDEDGQGQLLFIRRLDKDDRFCLHPHPSSVNNWDLWFASGSYMISALAERAFLTPDPSWQPLEWGHYYDVGYTLDAARVARWKAIALERMTTALAAQLGPDGDYAEGISYANYGGMAIMACLRVVEHADGINLWSPGLFALPRWARNQYVADIPFGVANYNDARMQTGLAIPLYACIAARSRDAIDQGLLLELLALSDDAPAALSLLGFDPTVPAAPFHREPATQYAHTGQVVWRTAEDRSGVFFSIKAGAHGGAHQHRDRTSIFLSAYGEHLIVDTGDSRYADPPAVPSFDETLGHNCLLVDGVAQIGSNDRPVCGHILEHVHDGDLSTVLADASECYETVAQVRRRVVFLRPDVLVMADRVTGSVNTLTWLLQGNNLDGKAAWELGDRCAVLARPGARVYVFFVEPATRQYVALGTMDNAQQAIMRLECDIAGNAVTTVLVPVRAGDPAPVCTRDGNTLTITVNGATHIITPAADAVTVDGVAYGFQG
jgi:hypothetical protein